MRPCEIDDLAISIHQHAGAIERFDCWCGVSSDPGAFQVQMQARPSDQGHGRRHGREHSSGKSAGATW